MEQAVTRVMASKSEPWMEVREAVISIYVVLLSTEPYKNLERVPASLPERFFFLICVDVLLLVVSLFWKQLFSESVLIFQ